MVKQPFPACFLRTLKNRMKTAGIRSAQILNIH